MPTHPQAGQSAPEDALVDVSALVASYYTDAPDVSDPGQRVAFGTSGHRGSSLRGSFQDAHIVAITQAVVEYRRRQAVGGPLVLGADTHALSTPAFRTALEVLVAAGVNVVVQDDLGPLPTPVVSHAILTRNGGRQGLRAGRPPERGYADGIVITPSHNPPDDGGFKYNPPHGGPADTDATGWIERRANELLQGGVHDVRRLPYRRALASDGLTRADLQGAYVADLGSAIDLDAVRAAGLRLGVDPMGGAALPTWERVIDRFGLDITITNTSLDPRFAFMPLDHDGVIRMDCSSPHAMAGLLQLAQRFDVAFGNDPDADRHGVVTPTGLLPPNHYLAVAIDYLFGHRPDWPASAAVGKTLVSSSMIDRVAARARRQVFEVPVGFKWFVEGLLAGSLAFGGEESAGATFLRRDGGLWTTDKDGVLLDLLAAEITAVTGEDPGRRDRALEAQLGRFYSTRVDAPASPPVKAALKALGSSDVRVDSLGGDPIEAVLTTAPGNDAAIGGLKVVTARGWIAARPSGTEDVSKVYAESSVSEDHLGRLVEEAKALVASVAG
jgi:phosphoglucomutase